MVCLIDVVVLLFIFGVGLLFCLVCVLCMRVLSYSVFVACLDSFVLFFVVWLFVCVILVCLLVW